MMTISDPDWRVGHGRRPIVVLDPEQTEAYTVWGALLEERIKNAPGTEVDPASLDEAIARQDRIGALIRHATWSASTIPLPTRDIDRMRARWQFVQELDTVAAQVAAQAREHALSDVPVQPVEDTCRHGVPFAGDCARCEEDA